jgi:hypothetical protein
MIDDTDFRTFDTTKCTGMIVSRYEQKSLGSYLDKSLEKCIGPF